LLKHQQRERAAKPDRNFAARLTLHMHGRE